MALVIRVYRRHLPSRFCPPFPSLTVPFLPLPPSPRDFAKDDEPSQHRGQKLPFGIKIIEASKFGTGFTLGGVDLFSIRT